MTVADLQHRPSCCITLVCFVAVARILRTAMGRLRATGTRRSFALAELAQRPVQQQVRRQVARDEHSDTATGAEQRAAARSAARRAEVSGPVERRCGRKRHSDGSPGPSGQRPRIL